MEKSQEGNQLSSVKNALRILRSFSMDEPEKRISDISTSLKLNKSTVSRTMSTLASEGFVIKDPETQKFRLGLSILSLSGIINSNLDIYQESIPVLNKLVEACGETAHISVLDQHEVIYLQKVECNHPVRFLTHVGKRNPAYCTSSGKVLLAFSNEEITEAIIANGLQRFTEHTITEPDALRTQLKQIKEQGHSYSYEELSEGVISIGTPIFDYTGKIVAALSVVGPKQRIHSGKIQSILHHTLRASTEVSSRLGYRKIE
ncbi:IclR family transcriptional regulator [Psychrobacillus sp. NPDC096426]|uniref:IclR family transcriptional regulator n=1 Tax=Psychrobacillus sp. NPDC096426 TaxID=3364491 RepID=UPI003806581D